MAALSLCAVAACALFVPGFVFGAEPPATTAESASASSTGTLLVTLPWGNGEGEVGLARPTEGLTRGPEALAVAAGGRMAVLDSVNRRVVFLDPEGAVTGTADVSLAEPRFLAVDDESLYILDCDADRRLLTLDWYGAERDDVALPELGDVVTGLFATASGPCVEIAHDNVFLVTDPTEASAPISVGQPDTTVNAADEAVSDETPTDDSVADDAADLEQEWAKDRADLPVASLHGIAGRPVAADCGRVAKVTFKAKTKTVRIKSFKLDRDSLTIVQTADASPILAPGRALDHLVSVDGDGADGLIIGARLLDNEATAGPAQAERPALLLTRLTAHKDQSRGKTTVSFETAATLLLADPSFAYVGQPYVVAPDGRVFQPVGGEDGYSIIVYTFAGGDSPGTIEEVLE